MNTCGTVNASPLSGWVTSRRKWFLDRLIALVLAGPALLVLVPLAAWSALSFRSNPIFRQQRVGLAGRPFAMLKLRTLPPHTPNELNRAQLEAKYEADGVARFLRQSHLDELPQVLQVLSGRMSLVGPRPMIQSIVDDLAPEFRRYRGLARPGLTGLWQISIFGEQVFHRYDPLDVAYLETANPLLDLRILLLTIAQVVGSERLGPRQIEASLGVVVHANATTISSVGGTERPATPTTSIIHPSYRVK